jgi:hypothetical protein
MRFILTTDTDFDAFWRAYREEVINKRFFRPEGADDQRPPMPTKLPRLRN